MDDEVLGVGGTIIKHTQSGDYVAVCFVCNRAYGHKYIKKLIVEEKKAAFKTKEILGYQEIKFLDLNDEKLDHMLQVTLIPLEEYMKQLKPEIVYINHRQDIHQDHKIVFQAGVIVCKNLLDYKIKKVMCYETPSSTTESPPFLEFAFQPNYYVDIEPYLEKKLKALRCYKKELRNFPHPRSVEGVKILAMKRGIEAGLRYAEAFMVMKEICQ